MVFERKSIPIVAAYWASKLSYMKRVIKDVFPTDCSPRKTSLNFRKGLEKDVSAMDLQCYKMLALKVKALEGDAAEAKYG